jgi:hypothetical protein
MKLTTPLHPSDTVKNEGRYTSNCTIHLHAVQKHNFTFLSFQVGREYITRTGGYKNDTSRAKG